MNQFIAIHGEESNEQLIEWNSQPPEDHFKYSTYPTNKSPVVSALIGRLNHRSIDNGEHRFSNSYSINLDT